MGREECIALISVFQVCAAMPKANSRSKSSFLSDDFPISLSIIL